jgi:undecaprenyl-phosphate 4-deoxy-4-formamido-L-arabinose transferase
MKQEKNNSSKKVKLSIVIPLYNSENTIEKLIKTLINQIGKLFQSLEIVLVNDDSKDKTEDKVLHLYEKYPNNIKYIALTKNFGEHNAVMCGLNYVTGDYAVIMDDDFQNPPAEVIKLVNKIKEGYDVVYSFYKKKKHSWLRVLGSKFNDWVATKLLKKPKGLYLSSFKILNKEVVDRIIQYKGPYPYIDGIILQMTNNIGTQECLHAKREEGKSNYTLKKLIHLWLNMFTGFSIIPLRISSYIGIIMSAFSLLLALFFTVSYFSGGILKKQIIPPGWASVIVAVTFLGGIQLILIGIIGEYLGRLFLTVNQLPQYTIKKVYIKSDNSKSKENE